MTNAPPAPPAVAEKRSGWKKLAVTLFVVAVLVAGVGALVFFRYVRPSPQAHRHLPRGTTIAMRADAVRILAFKPVRERLLPVLTGASNAGAQTDPRLARLRELTGVNLPGDLRELVIGSVDGKQWVAACGGTIEAGRFVDGLEGFLKEQGESSWTREGDVLVHPILGALGQADDGTLVAGTSKSLVLAALTARDEDPSPDELPLATDAALTFMMSSAAYRGALPMLPSFLSPVETLESIDRLNGALHLSDKPHVDVHLRPRGVPAAELATKLDAQLATVKLAMAFSPSDLGGARKALASATVTAKESDVLVHAEWPYEALDEGVARLAEIVGATLAHGRALK
jgi:hypothetical protein